MRQVGGFNPGDEAARWTAVEARLGLLVQRIDALEQIIANFVQSYTEIYSLLSAVTEHVTSSMDSQALTEFSRSVGTVQAGVLKMMQEAMDEMAASGARSADAAEPMAEQ